MTFAIYGVAELFEIAAPGALGSTKTLAAFDPPQLHALAYALLRVHSYGYGASLLFFGFCCICFGHLIQRSRYLPNILGSLLVIAGLGYVVFSIAQMLNPTLNIAHTSKTINNYWKIRKIPAFAGMTAADLVTPGNAGVSYQNPTPCF